MSKLSRFRNVSVGIIAISYILLFTYAAVSKLLDFEHFRIQIAKSPLLSAFADIVSIGVPLVEILMSLLFFVPRYRATAFGLATGLMSMFTAYIVIILNFSSYVPCSCGGILEKMGWTEHLVFNIVFVVLGLIAWWLETNETASRIFLFRAFGVIAGFSALLAVLFLWSEEEVHRNNAFLRRFPHQPATKLHGYDLTYNSYYIAGYDKGLIYLGNTTAPLHLLVVDTAMKAAKPIKIVLSGDEKYKLLSLRIQVLPPFFFAYDGLRPIVYKGKTDTWEARPVRAAIPRFSLAVALNDSTFAYRAVNPKLNLNVLGRFSLKPVVPVTTNPALLEKQVDGIFDTDGMLSYNRDLKTLAYVYYYRNGFVTANTKLKKELTGRTIDTISKADIQIVQEDSSRVRTLAKRPTLVSMQSATSGRYLFVKSDRLGKYEDAEMLKTVSVIDVYDITKNTYEFSFYLYNHNRELVRSFEVYGNLLIGLTDHYVVAYRLETNAFDFSVPKTD